MTFSSPLCPGSAGTAPRHFSDPPYNPGAVVIATSNSLAGRRPRTADRRVQTTSRANRNGQSSLRSRTGRFGGVGSEIESPGQKTPEQSQRAGAAISFQLSALSHRPSTIGNRKLEIQPSQPNRPLRRSRLGNGEPGRIAGTKPTADPWPITDFQTISYV